MFLYHKIRGIVILIAIIAIVFFIVSITSKNTTNFAMSSDNISNTSIENTTPDTLEMELISYIHSVRTFTSLSTEEVNLKLNNKEDFILYIGRATCQWCRKVAPALSYISSENNLDIFYLNSENTESNSELQEFRNNYGISTVPAIIVFSSQGNYNLIDFDATSDIEIIKKQLLDELL